MRDSLRSRRLRFSYVALASVAAGAVGVGVIVWATGAVRGAELDTVDARFSIRGTQEAPGDIVVVAIDDKTFGALGEQWPFRRSLHAAAIDRIARDRPRAIAYDLQFTEPTEPAEDEALIKAVADAGNTVLATSEVDERGRSNIFGGEEVLRDIGARAGHVRTKVDSGGPVRRYDQTIDGLDHFAVVVARTATGRRVPASDFEDGSAWIDFRGPPDTFQTVSFADVVAGRVSRGLFRDRIVVVGATAPTLQDLHPTSTSGSGLMSGAEIQANTIHTVLHGNPLREAPAPLDVALIVLLGLVAPAASLRFPPVPTVVVALAVGAAYVGAAQLAFGAGLILPLLPPLIALSLAIAGTLGAHYTVAVFERERVRGLFARFVPEAVVDEVLADTDEDLRLGGVQRECTVMFADLRGFTTFSEGREPEEVIRILNHYLGEVSDAIMAHGGTLIAYLGDGVMALFGAPLEQEDHADRAIAVAREIVAERLPRFNEWMRGEGIAEGFRMGVGLNTGRIVAGNVGSEQRLEYTAIGDTTNTASRLEELTKGSGHQVFIAESTREAMRGGPDGLVFVDELRVRGRAGTVKVWSLGAG
jgi:adenylate cyclase